MTDPGIICFYHNSLIGYATLFGLACGIIGYAVGRKK